MNGKAIGSGHMLRDMVAAALKSKAEKVRKEQIVGSKLYDKNKNVRADIVVHNFKGYDKLAFECKYQASNGTTYEKLWYMIETMQLGYSVPGILILKGEYLEQKKLLTYLKTKISGNLKDIMTLDQFITWLNEE